jgi:hypothetical protein
MLMDKVDTNNLTKGRTIREEIANIPAHPLLPMRTMSTFREAAFTTPAMVCEFINLIRNDIGCLA